MNVNERKKKSINKQHKDSVIEINKRKTNAFYAETEGGERENWLVRKGQTLRRRQGNKIYPEEEEKNEKTANCVGQITEN